MKKFISIFVLTGIFLSSFFAQDTNTKIWAMGASIHSEIHHSNNPNSHKGPVFSESSCESEDSEQRFSFEFDYSYFQNTINESRYIKKTLTSTVQIFNFNIDIENQYPIFLKNRSILI